MPNESRNPRIGKRGEYEPTQTISGYVATKPFLTVSGLDAANLYYAVIDTFPSVDVNTALEELRKGLPGESKRTPAKTSDES